MQLVFTIVQLALVGFPLVTQAAPARVSSGIEERDVVSDLLGDLSGLLNPSTAATPAAAKSETILDVLKQVRATATPTSPEHAMKAISQIFEASPTPNNLISAVGDIVAAGLSANNVETLVDFVGTVLGPENSVNNINLLQPDLAVYPQANPGDAPYSLTEQELRAAIHIPPTFRYGKGAQPIILVPGTGNTGYETFKGNYIPLLQGSSYGDPVWLNIPQQLLGDIQVNAEYVAYAINYIYGISGHRKAAVVSWSQGGIASQWAYKYWPSTRGHVTDQIAFSPDYHGTVLANLLGAPGEPLPTAVLQQEYNSLFINTLRSNGGDSALVPTTTIYSSFFDEVVEPMQGTGASAFLLDAFHHGVSNNEVQTVCNGQPAGGLYLHEGTLYNNLGLALLKDALAHDGPGRPERLVLGSVCSLPLSEGLDLADFLLTENAVVIAATSILLSLNALQEPPIKSYALKDAPTGH